MLTERIIRDAKPGQAPHILWDRNVVGLGVKVFPSGVKSFVLSYRVGGRKKLSTLAKCGQLSLRAARERAGAELVQIREGQTDPLERRRAAREAPSVADVVERYFREHVPGRIERGRMAERTAADYGQQARRYILPALGKLKIADMNRHHVEAMLKPLKPVQRNRVAAFLSALCNLCEVWELRTPGTNPVRKIERSRETARDRVLSADEMARLAVALAEMEADKPAAVTLIRFLAVTGLRVGEARVIEWEHLDTATGRLVIPESKTGRRWHTLPAPAVQILASLPRIGQWAFTTGGRAPLTYRTVRTAFQDACRRASIEGAQLHDLRRGVVSAAARSGANVAVLQQLLGHRTPQMALRYARELQNPVQATREAVAGQMAAILEGRKGGDVVPLERRRG